MSDRPLPSRIRPNTFQCPNALVDDAIMSVLSGNETKCYLVIVRKTLGWHKTSDRIAKSQIMAATGLGEAAVDGCMGALVSFGLVVRLAENNQKLNQGVLWALETDDEKIDWLALNARVQALAGKSVSKTENARKARSGGVVEQPQVVGQPEGGVVEQPPQKPFKVKDSSSTSSGEVFENLEPAEPEPKPPEEPKPEPIQKPNIFRLYEENIGPLTPILADKLKDAEKDYAETWIAYAFSEAVANEKRSWAYIESILKRIKTQGFGGERDRKLSTKAPAGQSNGKTNTGSGNKPIPAQPTPEQLAAIERINAKRRQQQSSD